MSFQIETDELKIIIWPDIKCEYNFLNSKFVIASEYTVRISKDSLVINIDFQQAKAQVIGANHTYYRFAFVGFLDDYKATYNILPQTTPTSKDKTKKFLSNIIANIIVRGMSVISISFLLYILTNNLLISIAMFVVIIGILVLFEILEDKVFDKIKHNSIALKRIYAPMEFERCKESDFIRYSFNQRTEP